MVALVELELELDAREERRRRMEDEPVRPGGDVGELPDAPVAVRLAGGDELVAAEELDEHACRGPAIRRVEDVGGEHQANLLAWARWARAISSSSALASAPSRTTSWPLTYSRSPRSFDAEPSTPSPTRTPASSMSRTGATPAPRRRFDVGQCATPVPVCANCTISVPERCTQCAHQTSPASQPSDSRYSTGEQPYSSWQ